MNIIIGGLCVFNVNIHNVGFGMESQHRRTDQNATEVTSHYVRFCPASIPSYLFPVYLWYVMTEINQSVTYVKFFLQR